MPDSVIERLTNTNPDMETWWDSSPLVFEQWVQKMLSDAPAAGKAPLEAQLRRLFNPQDSTGSLFRGCTTNPPLCLEAVKSDPEYWNVRIDELISANPGLDHKEVTWLLYKEVLTRGADVFRPLWDASRGRYGWISGQLDPRLFTEKDVMCRQAEELHALRPNVMVKVPASMEGVDVVRHLTSKGISTNVTVCFTVPQIMAAAKAAAEGLEIAKKNGVDTSRWRAVITHMIGRLTERTELLTQAERSGIQFTEADQKWFGLAVFKRAYRLLRDGGYPSKMLLCSMRPGPLVNGKPRFWDIQELAGGDIVFTLAPPGLQAMFAMGDDLAFRPNAIDDGVPQSTIDKVLKIPFGIQAYDPNGLSLKQFNTHPSVLFMVGLFSKAAAGLEDYVGNRMSMPAGV
jgi:transaldolase